MEFEVELETTKNYTTSFVKDTQGDTEEIRIKTAPDVLASLIMCINEGAKKFGYQTSWVFRDIQGGGSRKRYFVYDRAGKRGF